MEDTLFQYYTVEYTFSPILSNNKIMVYEYKEGDESWEQQGTRYVSGCEFRDEEVVYARGTTEAEQIVFDRNPYKEQVSKYEKEELDAELKTRKLRKPRKRKSLGDLRGGRR